jgi:glycosyltransferase involved in cell wall biosynthesis
VNVLLFNLRTDAADTTLGFTTAWVNELARRCERVDVVTVHAGELDLEPNVRVFGLSGRRTTKAQKVAEFYRVTARILRTSHIDVCFAHMTPHLAALFWPLARRRHIPILLWYAHGSAPRELRIAHRLVDRCVTSTSAGFTLPSDKLFVLSQGIDTDVFSPPAHSPRDYERVAISVGRLTRRKRLDEVIEAFALLRNTVEPPRLVIVGGPITDDDKRHEVELKQRIRSLQLDAAVEFQGAVPYSEIGAAYHLGGLFVNSSETGSLDKAILESMASGCIPVSRNQSFAAIATGEGLPFLVPPAGPEGIARAAQQVLSLVPNERDALRRRLREFVVENHSLSALMNEITDHLTELMDNARAGG